MHEMWHIKVINFIKIGRYRPEVIMSMFHILQKKVSVEHQDDITDSKLCEYNFSLPPSDILKMRSF